MLEVQRPEKQVLRVAAGIDGRVRAEHLNIGKERIQRREHREDYQVSKRRESINA